MKERERHPARAIAYMGVFLALSMLLSWVEQFLPTIPFAPGIKLGLANLVIVFVLFRMDAKSAILVSLLRVILMSILFGNVAVFLYSITGAVFSLVGMILLKKIPHFGILGVSIAGALLHNAGQILVACLLLRSRGILYYLPILILFGTMAGAIIGILGYLLDRACPKQLFGGKDAS